MQRILFLGILSALLFSCAEKVIDTPENLIKESKMTTILYDLAIINAARNTERNVLIKNNIESMDYIFTKYNIDSLQFVESNAYYASYPEDYEKMYKKIQGRLEKELDSMIDLEMKENDSLAKRVLKKTKLKKPESKAKDSLLKK